MGWALCVVCVILLAGEAWSAAPPAQKPQVRIDLVVAKVRQGEFTGGMLSMLSRKQLRNLRRKMDQGVREGRVNLVVDLRLVTPSGQRSSYLNGTERPFEYRDAAGRTVVGYEDIGTRVTVVPTILSDGMIHIDLEAGSSQECPESGGLGISRASTTVVVEPDEAFLFLVGAVTPGKNLLLVLIRATVDRPAQERETPKK
jgi:type II secretory pathway component HofQ